MASNHAEGALPYSLPVVWGRGHWDVWGWWYRSPGGAGDASAEGEWPGDRQLDLSPDHGNWRQLGDPFLLALAACGALSQGELRQDICAGEVLQHWLAAGVVPGFQDAFTKAVGAGDGEFERAVWCELAPGAVCVRLCGRLRQQLPRLVHRRRQGGGNWHSWGGHYPA